MQKNNSHQFALYFQAINQLHPKISQTLNDQEIVNRIISILRLKKGESVILFDQHVHALVHIEDISKKAIQIFIEEKYLNHAHIPSISFWLPLLKKESFEEALYSLAEMGAQEIQLVITEKSRQELFPKEFERAQRIIIAAAEQSKNFAYPSLHQPGELNTLKSSAAKKIYCDPQGLPVNQFLPSLITNGKILILIGPEGDLTLQEKEYLKGNGFVFMALTPTVLRASQAASLSLGMIRAWCNK